MTDTHSVLFLVASIFVCCHSARGPSRLGVDWPTDTKLPYVHTFDIVLDFIIQDVCGERFFSAPHFVLADS